MPEIILDACHDVIVSAAAVFIDVTSNGNLAI